MMAINQLPQLFNNRSHFVNVGKIGLDFAYEKVNLVQLGELTSGELALKSVSSLPYSEGREEFFLSPKEFKTKLRKAFHRCNFAGKKVVSSIPPSEVKTISIHYKRQKENNNDSVIISAIKERMDEDLSNYVIDYMPVRANEKETDQLAIVALVKKEIVTQYLEIMRIAGLVVEALEIRPAAINRYIYSILENKENSNILSVNFGYEKSYLTITSGRRLLFDKKINIGSEKIISDISSALDIPSDTVTQLIERHGFDSESKNTLKVVDLGEDYANTLIQISRNTLENLIDEINRALLFSASENHGETIHKIYLLGNMSSWKGLDVYLSKNLNVNVEKIRDPLMRIEDPYECANDEILNTPEFSIAIGHALRGLV
ncbi:MAG: pilus assembly protein PilM [Gammaproteobacteria bacterium]